MDGTATDQTSVKVLFALLGKGSATEREELGSVKALFFRWTYKNAVSRVGRRGRKVLVLLVTLILLVGFFVIFAAGEAQAQQSPTIAERHATVTALEVTRVAHGEAAEQVVDTASNEGRGSETFAGAKLWATASSSAAVTLPDAASAANALGPLSYGSSPDSPPATTKGSSKGDPFEGALQQPSSPSVPPAGGTSSFLSGSGQAGAGSVGPPLLFVLVSGLILLYPSGRLSSVFCKVPKPSSALLRPLERPG
jgi:hypothetical protein